MIHPSSPRPKAPNPQTTDHHFRHPIFFPMEEDDVEDLVHGANAVRPEYESAPRFHFLILIFGEQGLVRL